MRLQTRPPLLTYLLNQTRHGGRPWRSSEIRDRLHRLVFALDEEIFMAAIGSLFPSPGLAWSTRAYYVDGAKSHPTGDEAAIWRIQAVPLTVMFEESSDPKVEVKTLWFDEIYRVIHYMKDWKHDRVAAKQARSQVKSPHCWDEQNLITGEFTKNEFLARVMDHMADQDEPVGSNSPTWNFPRSGIGSKPNTPFSTQEFRKLSAGVHTHDGEEGMTDGEMSEGGPEESYTAILSVVMVLTAAAQEARENPKVDDLRGRLVKDYPRLFSGVANRNPPDQGRFGTARNKLKPNPNLYRHYEYKLQGQRAEGMKRLLKEFIERGWVESSESE